VNYSLGFWSHGVQSSGSSVGLAGSADTWVGLASGNSGLSRNRVLQRLLTTGSVAVGELDPLALLVALVLELDDLDI